MHSVQRCGPKFPQPTVLHRPYITWCKMVQAKNYCQWSRVTRKCCKQCWKVCKACSNSWARYVHFYIICIINMISQIEWHFRLQWSSSAACELPLVCAKWERHLQRQFGPWRVSWKANLLFASGNTRQAKRGAVCEPES